MEINIIINLNAKKIKKQTEEKVKAIITTKRPTLNILISFPDQSVCQSTIIINKCF